MRPLNFYSLFFLLLMTRFTYAQDCCTTQKTPWIFGLGANVINDSGLKFRGITDIQNNYNYNIPLRITLEKRFQENFGIEIATNFNTFLKGKTVNNSVLEEDISFFALDGMFNYYFSITYQIKERASYEAYLTSGLGVSFYDGSAATTANIGTGIYYYLSALVGLNLNAITKFSIDNSLSGSNYLQIGIGFIIKLEDSYFN